jgi:hypothetical protein
MSYAIAAVGNFSSFVNLAAKSSSPILSNLKAQSQEKRIESHRVAVSSPNESFFTVIADLARHPLHIVLLWNWKSAWLSIILRGPIFLAATIRRGLYTTISAVLTECFFCALTAGFYGAMVQSLRNAEPEWLTVAFLVVVVPAIFQVFEYLLHWLHGTPHLRVVEMASVVVSALSSLFNWYAMRRGALLVGGEGGTFGSDLRRLPRLIFNFVTGLPRWHANRQRTPHIARDSSQTQPPHS